MVLTKKVCVFLPQKRDVSRRLRFPQRRFRSSFRVSFTVTSFDVPTIFTLKVPTMQSVNYVSVPTLPVFLGYSLGRFVVCDDEGKVHT